jgi:hypothetical protein
LAKRMLLPIRSSTIDPRNQSFPDLHSPGSNFLGRWEHEAQISAAKIVTYVKRLRISFTRKIRLFCRSTLIRKDLGPSLSL